MQDATAPLGGAVLQPFSATSGREAMPARPSFSSRTIRLAVASLDAGPGAILRWRPDAVVLAHSPSRPAEIPWTGPHLHLCFHDAEGGRPHAPG